MAKLKWDEVGKRFYETGVSKGVLYPMHTDGTYPKGVAWSGLSQVSEKPSGAEPNAIWADNIKYLNLYSAEEFKVSIEAYTYPVEWAVCDGSAEAKPGVSVGQQSRKAFGLSYITQLGNDVDQQDYGYKIHLIYNCMASPSERSYQTINDNPEAISFNWEIDTTPVPVTGHKPTSCITINSKKVNQEKLESFLKIIHGDDSEEAKLPLPDEVINHFNG